MQLGRIEDGAAAEQYISRLATMPRSERHQITRDRKKRARERLQIIFRIERLNNGRCEKCRDHEGPVQPYAEYYHCDCPAAVEIRELGKRLNELTVEVREPADPVKVRRVRQELPPGLIEKAEANGIDYDILYKRIVYDGWDEESAATRPLGKHRRGILWTADMYQTVRQSLIDGKTYKQIHSEHFSDLMALTTFEERVKVFRDEMVKEGLLKPHRVFKNEDIERIRTMILNDVPRKAIGEAFPDYKRGTLDYRIHTIRKELKEKGLL